MFLRNDERLVFPDGRSIHSLIVSSLWPGAALSSSSSSTRFWNPVKSVPSPSFSRKGNMLFPKLAAVTPKALATRSQNSVPKTCSFKGPVMATFLGKAPPWSCASGLYFSSRSTRGPPRIGNSYLASVVMKRVSSSARGLALRVLYMSMR